MIKKAIGFFSVMMCIPFQFFSQQTYYVSEADGLDSNNGSQNSPLQTINRASSLSQPGDTILVLPGTYTYDTADNPWDNIFIANSGLADNYITFRGISDAFGNKPKIVSASNAGFTLFNKSYIVIDNFEVTTVNEDSNNVIDALGLEQWRERTGFNIVNNSHHIIVRNCYVHDMRGNGFQCGDSDVILLENNIVEHNAFHSDNGNSGISMYQMADLDVPNFPEFPNHRLIIKNNISRYNVNLRGFAGFENKMTDGNGIIIDDFRHTQGSGAPFTGRTLVIGNVAYGNGGMGINVFSSDHVDVYNNTLFDNAQTTRIINPAYEVVIRDAELQIGDADDISIKNNILINSGTGNTLRRFNLGPAITFNKNIHWNSTGAITDTIDPDDFIDNPQFMDIEGISIEETELLATMTNPFDESSISALLREPSTSQNFKIQNVALTSNSPAIDAGEDLGLLPFKGNTIDIGATEYNPSLSTRDFETGTNQVLLYPNPASSTFTIQLDPVKNTPNTIEINCMDMIGNSIFSRTISNAQKKVSIDVNTWSSGVYLVSIKSNSNSFDQKILVQ